MIDSSKLTPTSWDNFYVIVGSSSAALIGLQFVVLTLAAESRKVRLEPFALSAFSTPNVVHFAGVLFISGILTTPWPSISGVWIALLVCGLAGVSYIVRVTLRARRQTAYVPVLSDWLWHVLFPVLAYAGLAVGAWLLRERVAIGPFLVAAAAFALLFIGIHNAWDTVTYMVVGAETGREVTGNEE